MSDGRLTYSRIGGDPVLDLLNTVAWRLDPQRTVDDLPDYRAAMRWAQQCDIISDAEAAELQRQVAAEPSSHVAEQHAQLLDLRETIYAGLVDRSPEAVSRLTDAYVDSLRHARLQANGATWAWAERSLELSTLGDRVLRRTMALITSPAIVQLNQCEDSACGWVFLDTSRGGKRRWCSATDCGNRNRARRYYARHRNESHSDV